MRNTSYKSYLDENIGKFLSEKPRASRVLRSSSNKSEKTRESIVGSEEKKESLAISSQAPSIKSYPRRATPPIIRNLLLGLSLINLTDSRSFGTRRKR